MWVERDQAPEIGGEEATTDIPIAKPRRKQITGLTDSEKSIVHLLDNKIIRSLQDDLGEQIFGEESEITNAGDELDYEKELLKLALHHSEVNLLKELIQDLREANESKWRNLTPEDLYPTILTDASSINKKFTALEIIQIGKTLEQRTGRKFCKATVTKAVNANSIAQAFLGEGFIEIPKKKPKASKSFPSLQKLAKQILLSEDYKLLQLQISLANALHRERREDWFEKSPIYMWGYIPHVWEEHTVIKFFSYPEYSSERKQIEFRTLDYTHILTNMKMHILTKGYDFCKKEHFQELACLNPDLLSRPLVFDNIDQQNAHSAKLMFSEKVEEFMRRRQHLETAVFIKLVREWHSACDARGIRADTRVSMLYNMFTFLTEGVDFNSFPFPLTGRYWKGMPTQTYEAILQSICTRIQLYKSAHNRSYNHRAISTLSNESFFSDMSRMDKDSRSYPKACNIAKIFGRVVTLNYFKHLPDKSWYLTATHKGTYPEHLAEFLQEDMANQDGFYVNHFFDYPDEHESQRCHQYDVSRGTQPLRFTGGIRKFYRGDESKILPEDRAGIEPKPFPAFDKESGKILYNNV